MTRATWRPDFTVVIPMPLSPHLPALFVISTIEGQVDSLFLECYVEMATRVLNDLGKTAQERFGLRAWQIVHRFGQMETEDPIVFVATSADHRGEAFAACEFVMDTLKTDAPFWKREHSGDERQWVTVKAVDKDRRERWSTEGLDQ